MVEIIRDLEKYLTSMEGVYPIPSYRLFSYLEMPASCPWQFDTQQPLTEIIAGIFAPIAQHFPQTLPLLQTDCTALIVLQVEQLWYLIYAFPTEEKNDPYSYLIGGMPQTMVEVPANLQQFNWQLPPELQQLYTVHHGFGGLWPFGLFWMGDGVVSVDRLYVLSEYFPTGERETILYNPDNLLGFYPDGAGNGQFFQRGRGEILSETVDWDHETRELSHAQLFWEFVDNKWSDLIMRRVIP